VADAQPTSHLIIRSEPQRFGMASTINRLRAALKYLLRSYGFRVLTIRGVQCPDNPGQKPEEPGPGAG
jgi:hypothetical protein